MRLAKMLNKFPHEVRAAPATDIHKFIDVLNADVEVQKLAAMKRRNSSKGGGRRRGR